MSLRIGIDARFLTHPRLGGYQTYVQELVAAFRRRPPAHELWLVLASASSSVDSFHTVVQPVRIPFAGVAWREQMALPRLAHRLRFDVMHYPCNTMPMDPGTRSVASVHDTIGLDDRQPTRGLRQSLIRRYERFAIKNALRHAQLVITPSAAVADDVVRAGAPSSRVRTVLMGVRSAMRPASPSAIRAFRLERGLTRPFLLAFASADPRKNVETAIAALAHAAGPPGGLDLVILMSSSTPRPRLAAAAAEHGISDRVHFLDPVSHQDLALLYASARATLFLSLDEGFGLPPLESMACGTPVICSDRPPMNQLYGDAVLLVEPTDVRAVTAAIERLQVESRLVGALVERGRVKAAEFSWDRAAAETMAVYEEAARC